MLYILFFLFQALAFQNKDTGNGKTVHISASSKREIISGIQTDSFPNFKLPDQKFNYINIYEIKPKAYVLISIWNSKSVSFENPVKKLNLLYYQYQKSITFISISNDEDKKDWEKSIAKYNLKGVNLIDTKNIVTKNLNLGKEPAFILLDQNHKILEKFYSVIQLEKRLNEYYFINDGLRVRNRPEKKRWD